VRRTGRPEAPALFLLRIGLGGLAVYDGLVFKLLAVGLHLAPALGWPGLDLPPTVQSRLVGAVEVALGLLLLSGTLVRTAAGLHGLLVVGLTIEAAQAMADAFTRPLGAVPRNLVLAAASFGLAVVPAGRWDAGRQDRALAVVLRAGLGLMWLYEGLLVKWLPAVPVETELLTRAPVVPVEQALAFVRTLGVVEALLGLTVLVGFRVRELAVLQVGLLGAVGALIGWASPTALLGAPGGLSRHLAVMGCALLLYHLGAGALSVDGWMTASPAARRYRLLAALRGAWRLKVAMAQAYEVQVRAVPPDVSGLLQQIEREERRHRDDLASLIERHGGRRLPARALPGAVGWLAGCLTAVAGARLVLLLDLWAKTRALMLYGRAERLVPPDEGLTDRALQAMQGRESAHEQLFRDSLHRGKRRR
jgi:uncharacterized membrane protein YphA (DoxX/SURF4 family)